MWSDLHNTWYESDPQPLICHVSLNLAAHGICIQTLRKTNDAGGDRSSRPSWKHSRTRLPLPRRPSIFTPRHGSCSCHDHPSTNLALKRWHCCFTAYVTFFPRDQVFQLLEMKPMGLSLFSIRLTIIPVLLPLLGQSLAITLTPRTQDLRIWCQYQYFKFWAMSTPASLISSLFGDWRQKFGSCEFSTINWPLSARYSSSLVI